jgi:hypothetical protein
MESESRPILFALYVATLCIHTMFFGLAFLGEPIAVVRAELFEGEENPMRFYLPIFISCAILVVAHAKRVPQISLIIFARIFLGVATAVAAYVCFAPTMWLPFVLALPLLLWSYREFRQANAGFMK